MLHASRPADVVIGEPPYLMRWHILPRNRVCNVYLHHILRSDDDRALHDHPWPSVSFVLRGGYFEVTDGHQQWFGPGAMIVRRAAHRHRLVVPAGRTAWSLFFTGPRLREWGFWCPQGFVPWHEFVSRADAGKIGAGCGEQP